MVATTTQTKAPKNPFKKTTKEKIRVPKGYLLVPIEPTWEMQNYTSLNTDINSFLDIQAVWKAMLLVAPKVE